APARADRAVLAIGHAGLEERDARAALRARQREGRSRVMALRPIVRAPRLHDPPVLGQLEILPLEVVPDLERSANAPAPGGALAGQVRVLLRIHDRIVDVVLRGAAVCGVLV